MKLEGTIEEMGEVKMLSQGVGKRGKWALYGAKITVKGDTYTLKSFDEKEVAKEIEGITTGDYVEFDVEKNEKGYWSIVGNSLHCSTTHPKTVQPAKQVVQGTFQPAGEIKEVTEPEVPSIEVLTLIANDTVEKISSIEPRMHDIGELFRARVTVFTKLLECEYAWRTSKYIQACKKKNIKSFRR